MNQEVDLSVRLKAIASLGECVRHGTASRNTLEALASLVADSECPEQLRVEAIQALAPVLPEYPVMIPLWVGLLKAEETPPRLKAALAQALASAHVFLAEKALVSRTDA